jgi:hypothetical protein
MPGTQKYLAFDNALGDDDVSVSVSIKGDLEGQNMGQDLILASSRFVGMSIRGQNMGQDLILASSRFVGVSIRGQDVGFN